MHDRGHLVGFDEKAKEVKRRKLKKRLAKKQAGEPIQIKTQGEE